VQNEIVPPPQAAFWKPEAWTSCGSNESMVLVVYLAEVNGNNIVVLEMTLLYHYYSTMLMCQCQLVLELVFVKRKKNMKFD
jgi:hypothetical protein